MPPEPVTFPERRFVVTQTVGGVETNVMQSTALPRNYTSDQVERKAIIDEAFIAKNAQPGVLYKVYSPSNGGPHVDGDLIWRSDLDYGDGS